MKISKKVYVVSMALMLGFTMAACGTGSKDTKKMAEKKSEATMKEKKDMKDSKKMGSMSGMFNGEMDINVKGNVEIKGNSLMLTEFSSDNGPDVHVWLTKDGNMENGYDVSKIDVNGMKQTFDISMNTVDSYNTVVIYCNDAHKVFGTAALSEMK